MRILQKIDDFLYLLFGFLQPCDVGKCNLYLVALVIYNLRLGLAHAENTACSADTRTAHAPHYENPKEY